LRGYEDMHATTAPLDARRNAWMAKPPSETHIMFLLDFLADA
jgi:hypothetical protein